MHRNSSENFSIIVPTYREAKNVAELVKRISQVNFEERLFELIFVDDQSDDGIVDIVHELQSTYPWVKLVVRTGARGLSAAVLEGFQNAAYPLFLVMDADLSHPAEKIPDLITQIEKQDVDFVIGSRYVSGGSADIAWSLHRKFISQFSAFLARVVLSSNVKDPLSGFFAVKRKTVLAGDTLNPIGWKISLEIMMKCHCRHIQEIPIHFSERLYGESKLNFKIMLAYIKHLQQLMRYRILF